MAINDRVAKQHDLESMAKPTNTSAGNSGSRTRTQPTVGSSKVLNARVSKTPGSRSREKYVHTRQTPIDQWVPVVKAESNEMSTYKDDDQETELEVNDSAEENQEDNKVQLCTDDKAAHYEWSSDEEWEGGGGPITRLELPRERAGLATRQRDVFAVTFECKGDGNNDISDDRIVGVYHDIQDANRAAHLYARQQGSDLRHKERVYGDGTFHARGQGGGGEWFHVDVSRVKYFKRKR